ncbi:hypothetical protein BACFRA24663_09090 [Bacteroides fragilis]
MRYIFAQCFNIKVWNKAIVLLVIKTVNYVQPPHFYIRNRIVHWAFKTPHSQ